MNLTINLIKIIKSFISNRTFRIRVDNQFLISRPTKVYRLLYSIINCKSPIPLKNRLNLIKMYITPKITYGGKACAPFIKRRYQLKLDAIQTIYIKLLASTPKYVRNAVIRSTYKFQPVESIIRCQSQSFFIKNTYFTHQHIKELSRS